MLIGLRSNADSQVHLLTISPVDPLGKLDQPHPGTQNVIAGLRRAMRDRHALPKKSRTLRLTRLQTLQIRGSGQPTLDQRLAQHGQCLRLIRRMAAHLDLAGIKFEHGYSSGYPV